MIGEKANLIASAVGEIVKQCLRISSLAASTSSLQLSIDSRSSAIAPAPVRRTTPQPTASLARRQVRTQNIHFRALASLTVVLRALLLLTWPLKSSQSPA